MDNNQNFAKSQVLQQSFTTNSMNKMTHRDEKPNSLELTRLKLLRKNRRKTIIHFSALCCKKGGDFKKNERYLEH